MSGTEVTKLAKKIFPKRTRLNKVSLYPRKTFVKLWFDFPLRISRHYAAEVQQLKDLTGWKVSVARMARVEAVRTLLRASLPSSIQGRKTAFTRVNKESAFSLRIAVTPEELINDVQPAVKKVEHLTGCTIEVTARS